MMMMMIMKNLCSNHNYLNPNIPTPILLFGLYESNHYLYSVKFRLQMLKQRLIYKCNLNSRFN